MAIANNNQTSSLTSAIQNQDLLPIEAQIISQTSGRIRLRVAHPYRQPDKIAPLADALKQRLDIYRVRTNISSGSITIFHGREISTFEDISAVLQDLGIIFVEITEKPLKAITNQSNAAAEITKAATDLNQRVKQATKNTVDLRFLVPLGLGTLALRQLLVKGLQLEIIPWYVLAWYAFDSFIKLHYTQESLPENR